MNTSICSFDFVFIFNYVIDLHTKFVLKRRENNNSESERLFVIDSLENDYETEHSDLSQNNARSKNTHNALCVTQDPSVSVGVAT